MDTKKLRQKILDLAIHGKLVPQDPNDEPASVLLERIRKEKEQLIKEGKIKVPKKSKSAGDTSHYPKEGPWELPEGWCWTTLGEISDYGQCITVPVSTIKEDEWILELEDIEKDTGRILKKITKRERSINGSRHAFTKNQILYSKLRTYLNKVLIAPSNGYCTTEIIPISPEKGIIPEYLYLVLRSQYFQNYTAQCGYGMKMPRLGTSDAIKALIPIPASAEQKRIIDCAKKYTDIIDRIHAEKEQLSVYVTKSKSIILEHAIHGKLVPQDSSEEPAIVLLRRINPNFKPSDNLHYEDCPIGWQVVTLKEIVSLYSGRDLEAARCNAEHRGIPYLVGASCIDNQNISVYRWTENPEVVAKINDTLLSCKGTVGEVILNQLGDVHIARQFMSIRSKSPQLILPKYIELIIKASIEKLKSTARGIIPGISREDILEMTVAIPPLAEQKRILTRISELESSLSFISLSIRN